MKLWKNLSNRLDAVADAMAAKPCMQGCVGKTLLSIPRTPGNLITAVILAIGLLITIGRFGFGLGAVTNLDDNNPWGIWIAFDLLCGVALAAGGYVTSSACYLFGMKRYHSAVRPAILTAFLGYAFVVVALLYDVGQPWRLPYPLVVSQGTTSLLFEVGLCVGIYLTVLFIEWSPVGLEWLLGMKDAPSFTAAKANRDKRDQAEGKKINAYAEIWAHPRMRKSFIIWSISMILYFYGYYGLITWLPNYVQSQVGMQSGGWITAAGYIAMIIGTAGGGKIADKIGRKKLFLIGTIGTAIFGLCLAFWANSSNILVLMLLYGVCYGMPTGIHATFIGECFPTHLRSTGVGFTFNIGRLGAFVAPILMGKLVDMNMISVAIATVTISYVLCSLATLPIKEREYDASNVAAQLED